MYLLIPRHYKTQSEFFWSPRKRQNLLDFLQEDEAFRINRGQAVLTDLQQVYLEKKAITREILFETVKNNNLIQVCWRG